MDSEKTLSPENCNTGASPILSDEEIRARAAAYAQQIYEQQLEAYRVQREQFIAAQQARQEYERQWQVYAQACKEFEARQKAQPVVRIDPATGEQIYAAPQNTSDSPAYREPEITEEIPEASIPATGEAEDPSDSLSEETPAEENEPPLAEENVADAGEEIPPEEDASLDGNPSELAEEEIPEDVADEQQPVQDENPEPEEAQPDSLSEEQPLPASTAEFTPFSMFLIVVCVAVLAAVGYILFSDDPRFERQRSEFFTLLGVEKSAPASESAPQTTPDEFVSAVSPETETVPEEIPENTTVEEPESDDDWDSEGIFEE